MDAITPSAHFNPNPLATTNAVSSLDNQLLTIFNQALSNAPTASNEFATRGALQGAFDGNTGLAFDPTLRGKTDFTVSADKAPALGDAILQGIKKASNQYQESMQAVQKDITAMAKNPKSISPNNLLSLQLNLMQLDSQVNIASKIANKVSQGIQTLFKNQ